MDYSTAEAICMPVFAGTFLQFVACLAPIDRSNAQVRNPTWNPPPTHSLRTQCTLVIPLIDPASRNLEAAREKAAHRVGAENITEIGRDVSAELYDPFETGRACGIDL